jgi:ABC-type transport system involved in multi-copper enzyme maturation permease subunit
MTWLIFRKELAYHITTPRVLIFFIISTSLFIINGLTFVGNYKYDLETYSEVQARNWTGRHTAGTAVIAEPGRLEFCVEGGAHIRPRTLFINLDDTIQSARRSQYENFKLPDVRRIDWSFIIQTVYALFCVVLTFDAISGERARGTLRLMMANSVSRAQILLGKYLAVLAIVLVVLLIGWLLSLAVMNLLSVTVPAKRDIAPLMLFMVLSVLYISLFISISLLASSLARTSSTALLSLLFIVIVLVFVVPNMAGIVAGKLVDAPGDYETRARSDAFGKEYLEAARELRERVTKGTLTDRDEIAKEDRRLYMWMIEERNKMNREYERGLMRKQAMAETLILISPSGAFQASGESLVNTGGIFHKRLRKAAEIYKAIYLNYVRSKVGEIIPSWMPPSTYRLPDGTVFNIPEVQPKRYDGDMSDFPAFASPGPPIHERLGSSLFSIALLLLWNVVFFMGAHIVFIRRDIR